MKRRLETFTMFVVWAITVAAAMAFIHLMAGCDTAHTIDGRIVIVIECNLPAELCGASDAEFTAFWDSLDEAERHEFIEEWGRPEPRSGFVAVPNIDVDDKRKLRGAL